MWWATYSAGEDERDDEHAEEDRERCEPAVARAMLAGWLSFALGRAWVWQFRGSNVGSMRGEGETSPKRAFGY